MRRSPCRSPVARTSVGWPRSQRARFLVSSTAKPVTVFRAVASRSGEMNPQPSTRNDIYGHRARIGYTCPPLSAEVFPYEFYTPLTPGGTRAITTMTVRESSHTEDMSAYEEWMTARSEYA